MSNNADSRLLDVTKKQAYQVAIRCLNAQQLAQ